jgi:putative ABC transport system permease protein
MDDIRPNRVVAMIARLYGWLLIFYPASFRRAFGMEMSEVFANRCWTAHSEGGVKKLIRVAASGLFDLFATASAERVEMIAARRPTIRTRAEAFALDASYAMRTLVKRPGFALMVLITLTLAIGGTTAIFSVMDAALLRPLPFRDPDRLVTLWELLPQGASFGAMAGIGVAPLNYIDWKAQNQVFSQMALVGAAAPNFRYDEGSEQLTAERVSDEFLTLLGIEPSAGRAFKRDDFNPAAPPVAIVSHEFWQRRLAGSASALGRTLRLDNQVVTVVGVMPSDLNLPSLWGRSNDRPDLWIPIRLTNDELASRRHYAFRPLARLKPGVTLQQADAEMAVIARRLAAQYPGTNTGMGIGIVPLKDQLFQDLRPGLLLLLGATSFVLLIACVNVANLLLVRTAARRREIALRAALGATRGSIVRQLMTESLILALGGGVCGLLVARWTIPVVIALIPQDSLMPRLAQVGLDFRVLLFTLAVSALTSILFGLIPALEAAKCDVNDALKEGGRSGGEGRRSHRLANGLVVAEVSLALVLSVGAGVLVQSFRRLDHVNPGFSSARLLTLEVPIPAYKFKTEGSRVAVYVEMLRRVKEVPGVVSASLATLFPDAYIQDCVVEGRTIESRSKIPQVAFRAISSELFETLRMPIHRGRGLNERDTNEKPRVAVISERMARRLWPGEEAIGRRFRPESEPKWFSVVGVVGDIQRKTTDQTLPEYYVPYTQVGPWQVMNLIVRTETDPLPMAPFIRNAVYAYDQDIAIREIKTVDQALDQEAWRHKLSALLMGGFAGVALLLAAAGIYGVMSYSVTQRTGEMGLRLALGARPRDVRRMIIAKGLRLALAGVAIGLIVALTLARFLSAYLYAFRSGESDRLALARQIDQHSALLYGISATDPITLAAVSAVLIAVALLACYLPARRATALDPLASLRSE